MRIKQKHYLLNNTHINEQIKRNKKRFPYDFMFRLTKKEYSNLILQFAISSWGGTRKLPYVFTEQGVAMLSSVLHSERAIEVNITIMRVFTKLRGLLMSHIELRQKIEEIENTVGKQGK